MSGISEQRFEDIGARFRFSGDENGSSTRAISAQVKITCLYTWHNPLLCHILYHVPENMERTRICFASILEFVLTPVHCTCSVKGDHQRGITVLTVYRGRSSDPEGH